MNSYYDGNDNRMPYIESDCILCGKEFRQEHFPRNRAEHRLFSSTAFQKKTPKEKIKELKAFRSRAFKSPTSIKSVGD